MNVAFSTSFAPYEKSKSLGSGGSMVARLKLKGIDGRAPPGVNYSAPDSDTTVYGWYASMTLASHARSSYCGKFSAIQPILPSID